MYPCAARVGSIPIARCTDRFWAGARVKTYGRSLRWFWLMVGSNGTKLSAAFGFPFPEYGDSRTAIESGPIISFESGPSG
jgi:hypothetical protein